MLSEEQAIEKLKKIKEDTIKANECGLSNNDFKEEIEVYDTILNLITKKKEEIKKMNIKNDIEILEKFVEETKNFENENGWHGYYDIELKAVREAIQNILAERKQDKKRIQELENRIDKLVAEMRENGSNYWANKWEKVKEEK